MVFAENDIIRLEQYTHADDQDMYACWQDAQTQKGYNFSFDLTFEELAACDIDHFPFWCVIIDKAANQRVGCLRLGPDDACPDLAIWIYPKFRSLGYGAMAFSLAANYILEQLPFPEISAGCYCDNKHSLRMLEKVGFRRCPEEDLTEINAFTGELTQQLVFRADTQILANLRLTQIRENERKSHMDIYSSEELYDGESWLKKPVKTVVDLFWQLENHTALRVLDLGCGVGRNCIAIAQHFRDIPCLIDCVDILDFAIEKLNNNANRFGVSSSINGITSALEDYPIQNDSYDLILAVSALEHIDTKESFLRKLAEIKDGIRKDGIVCLIINSSVREHDKLTGKAVPPQFEVNLPTEELQELLSKTFAGWEVIKSTIRKQRYDIPRENCISDLQSNVVTYVAKKDKRST